MSMTMTLPQQQVSESVKPLTLADEIRNRFLAIQRDNRLAPELDCFGPGGSLSSIRYIANANSIHVVQWLKLLAHTSATVEMETANPSFPFSNECFSSRPLLPNWFKAPMILRYIAAGLRLRFSRSRNPNQWVHAHSASGNGLVAWLSGQPYLIGTYGSEIFASDERGALYRWLMRRVLSKAERIQTASTECVKMLQEMYDIPSEKIYCFHLGLEEKIFHGVDHAKRMQLRREADMPVDQPIWISNRRTHPLYRTQEIVTGFLEFARQNPAGRLILLNGSHQPDYTQAIQQLCQNHEQGHRVKFIDRFLTHPEVAAWLQLADFAISVPKTDMLSVSTYQALGCGAVTVLSDLASYDPLRPCSPIFWMKEYQVDDFTRMFRETASTCPAPHDAHRKICLQFTQDRYSTENAVRDIAAFYLGQPLRADGMAKWAA